MTVKIITDSTADIPQAIVKELGITVLPEYLIFGDKSFRDRVDITEDEFYDKLIHGKTQPTTSQPTPQDFVDTYNEIGKNADGIVAIHLSSHLSGTVNSAERAKKLVNLNCPVEVIDSKLVAMPLGMVVIMAARMAQAGKSYKEVVAASKSALSDVKFLAMFDTLEYLAKGGRIGKAKSLVGSLLNVKPLLTLKNGEFVPIAQVRSKAKGKEKLLEFSKGFKNIEDMSVVYSTTLEEAKELVKNIESFPTERIILARLGPVVGSHAGPGLLAIAVRTKN
jgi:DegV family protein with EDD domain